MKSLQKIHSQQITQGMPGQIPSHQPGIMQPHQTQTFSKIPLPLNQHLYSRSQDVRYSTVHNHPSQQVNRFSPNQRENVDHPRTIPVSMVHLICIITPDRIITTQ